jgi:hypothetical protein
MHGAPGRVLRRILPAAGVPVGGCLLSRSLSFQTVAGLRVAAHQMFFGDFNFFAVTVAPAQPPLLLPNRLAGALRRHVEGSEPPKALGRCRSWRRDGRRGPWPQAIASPTLRSRPRRTQE